MASAVERDVPSRRRHTLKDLSPTKVVVCRTSSPQSSPSSTQSSPLSQVSPGPTTPLLTPLVTPLVTPSVTPSASRSASLNNSPAYFPTAGTGFPKISKRKLTRLITAVNKQSRPDLVDPSEIFLSSPPSRPSNTECTRRLPN